MYMIVTDKEYYLDNNLVDNLDFCLKRESKGWDNLLIIDGEERTGKTTVSWAIGYYLAWRKQKGFSNVNIFFDVDKMMEFAMTHRNEIIVWDEAALDALSTDWYNKTQKKLIKVLMTCGKYNHFWIFLIPYFFKLKDYLAVDRSIGLLHVYSPDQISRGDFVFYNKRKKKYLYFNEQMRKYRNYGKDFNFAGKYTNTSTLIDVEAYEKAKDEAIASIDDNAKKNDPMYEKYMHLRKGILSMDRYSDTEIARILGFNKSTISKWRSGDENSEESLGRVDLLPVAR